MPAREPSPAVVVGAGPAGLGAAAALSARGIPVVVLERSERVGDRWRSRYDRLRLHTVRAFSGLPHTSIPRSYGRWVAKDDFAAYLDEYARTHRLDVRTGVHVRRISRDAGEWTLETADGTWRTTLVVVATGRYGDPEVPDWPGRDAYEGRFLHAAEFRTGDEFRDMRVLVVGLGNSGAEIAAELTEHAASVAVSVRTPPPIARRQMAGIPLQLLGIALTPLPARPVDRVGALLRKLSVGDLRPYGLEPAAWGPFVARRPPVIDVGFLDALRARKLRIVPALTALTPEGAVFADETQESFDAVVAATGYRSGLDELVDAPGALTDDGQPRSLSPLPGLAFVGFRESVRGQLYEANREARAVARDFRSQPVEPRR